MADDPKGTELALELSTRLDPRLASVIRRFVQESLETMVGDHDCAARVAMVAHELMENAAKYATSKRSRLAVGLGPGKSCEVRATNDTTPMHLARLREVFERLQGARRSPDFYRDLMRKSLEAGDESGLGLARICVEGDFALALEVEGATVTIVAQTPAQEGKQHG